MSSKFMFEDPGTADYDYFEDYALDELFAEGFGQILDAVVEDKLQGMIQLESIVSSVDYEDDFVTVTTNKGSITARQVIVTVTLGVLKSGSIK